MRQFQMPKHFKGLLSRNRTRSTIEPEEDEDEVDTDVLPADEDGDETFVPQGDL